MIILCAFTNNIFFAYQNVVSEVSERNQCSIGLKEAIEPLLTVLVDPVRAFESNMIHRVVQLLKMGQFIVLLQKF